MGFCINALFYSLQESIKRYTNDLFSGNGRLASWCTIFGFIVMMSLDVGLG